MTPLRQIAHIAAAALSPLKFDATPSWWKSRSRAEHGLEPVADAAIQQETSVPPTVCLFCLQDDESLNTIIDSNETFYARLDNFPATPGHIEIVPKRHVVSFFDLSKSEIIDAYTLMQAVEKKLSVLHGPGGYTIGVNEGRVAGRSIDHLHIHLIPRYEGDVTDPRGGIRQIVPNFDPDSWVAPTQPSSPAR